MKITNTVKFEQLWTISLTRDASPVHGEVSTKSFLLLQKCPNPLVESLNLGERS